MSPWHPELVPEEESARTLPFRAAPNLGSAVVVLALSIALALQLSEAAKPVKAERYAGQVQRPLGDANWLGPSDRIEREAGRVWATETLSVNDRPTDRARIPAGWLRVAPETTQPEIRRGSL